MALTTVVSGAQVLANDADQFRQLLTGAMIDQVVTIANSTVLGGASVGHEARLGPTIYGDATRLIVGWSQRLNHAYVLLGRNLTGTTGSDSYTTPSAQANVGYAGIELTDTGPINVYVQTGTMTAGGTIVSPNLVATFGAAAVTMAQPVLVPLGSAAAPSSTFNGDTNTGVYSPGADQWAVATGGVQRVLIDASGNVGIGTTPIVVGTANRLSVQLPSANGNLLAYFSKVQATNDTGGYITFGGGGTGTVARGYIGLTSTGTSGPTLFTSGEIVNSLGILAVGALQFGVNNAGVAWQMTSAGHFVAGVDNTYDIGASGATRPRNVYISQSLRVTGMYLDSSVTGAYFNLSPARTIAVNLDERIMLVNGSITNSGGTGRNLSCDIATGFTISAGATTTRAAQLNIGAVTATVNGTLSNHNSIYVGNPSGGTTVRAIDSDSGAYLTTAGVWTNNPSWQRYKTADRDVSRSEIVDLFEWLRDHHKPKVYRHDGTPLDADDPESPRPIHQDYEYDTFGFFLDDMPEKVRRVICADPAGGISTKDTDALLLALVQEAARQIDELRREVNAKANLVAKSLDARRRAA